MAQARSTTTGSRRPITPTGFGHSMTRKLWRKLYSAVSLVVVLTLAMPWAAFADNLVGDGDGALPITGNALSFGTTVCAGTTVQKSVLLAIVASGHPGAGTQVFGNSASVTLSVSSVTGSGLSATVPASPGNKITLATNWTTLPNNTLSSSISSTATFVAGTAGAFTGSIAYQASGTGSSTPSVTRTTTVPVSATVVNCDTTPPTLNLPANITTEATGPSGALVSFNATASDTAPASPAVTCKIGTTAITSPRTFPLGATMVSCSATDGAGNTATGSFTVTVQDTTAPTLTLPADIIKEATGPSGETASYTASASDLVDGNVPVTCSPASGATFALGTTTVTCSATDAHHNTTSGGFTVAVQDTTPPVLSLTDISAEATGPSGATVMYTATASDLVDGAVSVSCSPASGTTFALGTTTVSCSASDAHHNLATGIFHLTVHDTTAPVLTLPADITAEATGPTGAPVSYSASAVDIVDGSITPNCAPASGSVFSLDVVTGVSCSASDAAGNTASGTFAVTVRDTTAPTLSLPADVSREATGPSGVAVSFTATASDLVDGSVAVNCGPASGATFALGATTVTCSAADAHSNTASGSFIITVVDTTPPSLSLPSPIAEATGPTGAAVTYTATANDIVDGSVAVSCAPLSGSTFALGTTTVSCSATDAHGNAHSGTFTVVVVDTTPPALTLPADMVLEASSPSGAVGTYTATASDVVDGAVAVACTPASGSTFPLAATSTVSCSATDAHGNTGSSSFSISVRFGRDSGILQPINPDNTSLFKRGQVVPVKFQLKNDGPNGFSTANWTVTRIGVNCITGEGTALEEPVASTTPSSTVRYDAAADQYIYNADFRTAQVNSCWKVAVDLKDGSLPLNSAVFKLGK
jgi:HYR domain